jgi:membrane protease YdiL (CAAX protease family)
MDRNRTRWNAGLALALLVPAPSLGTLLAMWWVPGPIGQVCYGLCKIWLLVLPITWTVLIDRAQLSWSPPRHGGLTVGAISGIVIALTIWLAYEAAGRRWIDATLFREAAERNGFGTPVRYMVMAVYLMAINSLLEEYAWRWFVFRHAEMLWPKPATFLAALFFTLHHVIALAAQVGWIVTVIGSIGVFAGGWIWSWCYARYRSIWPGYVSHAIVDLAILSVGWKLIFA